MLNNTLKAFALRVLFINAYQTSTLKFWARINSLQFLVTTVRSRAKVVLAINRSELLLGAPALSKMDP